MSGMQWVNTDEWFKEVRKAYNEKDDCTVAAFAVAFNTTYEMAYEHLKMRMGRKHRKGIFFNDTFLPSIKHTKVKRRDFNPNISLSQFCKDYPSGRYIVLVRGHALAVVDGVVHDYKHGPRRLVKTGYRIHV